VKFRDRWIGSSSSCGHACYQKPLCLPSSIRLQSPKRFAFCKYKPIWRDPHMVHRF